MVVGPPAIPTPRPSISLPPSDSLAPSRRRLFASFPVYEFLHVSLTAGGEIMHTDLPLGAPVRVCVCVYLQLGVTLGANSGPLQSWCLARGSGRGRVSHTQR